MADVLAWLLKDGASTGEQAMSIASMQARGRPLHTLHHIDTLSRSQRDSSRLMSSNKLANKHLVGLLTAPVVKRGDGPDSLVRVTSSPHRFSSGVDSDLMLTPTGP